MSTAAVPNVNLGAAFSRGDPVLTSLVLPLCLVSQTTLPPTVQSMFVNVTEELSSLTHFDGDACYTELSEVCNTNDFDTKHGTYTSGMDVCSQGHANRHASSANVTDVDHVDYVGRSREVPLFTVTSPLGEVVTVYQECVAGMCKCIYSIGDIDSQLRPCCFASYILGGSSDFNDKYLELLWLITDGCPIVDTVMEHYECANYLSITCPGNYEKMSLIIEKELREGMVSKVTKKPVCVHALGAVPKATGGIRPITDCSRPEGKSVNFNCTSLLEDFSFKSVSDVASKLQLDDYMCVVDIKSAYRAVPIRAAHRTYQGFSWETDGLKSWYVDNRMCFGLRLGPKYFNYISTFIYDILSAKGLTVVNYLDDFIAITSNLGSCIAAQAELVGLLRYLGFHVAFDKLVHPSTCVTYLGIEIDSSTLELRLPSGKLEKLRNSVSSALARKRISKKELESLGGTLSHCSHVVRGRRIFSRNVYSLYRTLISENKRFIAIPEWVKDDLRWWQRLSMHFNGVCKIVKCPYEHALVSDASFKGFGVYLGHDWCAGTWDDDDCILLTSKCNHVVSKPLTGNVDFRNINVLEFWPILVGVKRWASYLRDTEVTVFTDNTQVLYMLLNGKSSNATCMSWIRELFWVCALFNIGIKPKYIITDSNLVADTLSRIPYLNVSSKLEMLLSGSNLCCLTRLFANYRAQP